MEKAECHPDYPPEEGRYIRGNDKSPVAVVIILNHDEDKIPPETQLLVRTGAESGAALAGTLQTPNIGLEKVICNIVANPNIRYLILSGPESEGHRTGDAIKALFKNGIDEKKFIIGTDALHPLLYNIPTEFVDRLREQVTLVDLQFKGSPEIIRKAVWSCYQEEPVDFEGYNLYDPGPFKGSALSGKISDRVAEAWKLPQDEGEKKAVDKMQTLIESLRKKQNQDGKE